MGGREYGVGNMGGREYRGVWENRGVREYMGGYGGCKIKCLYVILIKIQSITILNNGNV